MQELRSEYIFYVHILSQYLLKEFNTYHDIMTYICRFFRPNIMIKASHHSSMIIIDGKLYITEPYINTFKYIDIPDVYDVSATEKFTFILTKTGTYTLKNNRKYTAIYGFSDSMKFMPSDDVIHNKTIKVNSNTYKSIKTGGRFGLVLNNNNTVSGNCYNINRVIYRFHTYAKTDNEIGEFINGVGNFNKYKLQNVISIECSDYHAMVITHDGLYGWGENYQYQLGLGHNGIISGPTKIDINNIVEVSCGACHTMAIDIDGNLYGFGFNEHRQITDTSITHHKLPHKLELTDVINVKCWLFHSIALTRNGKLYGWGGSRDNKNGHMREINFKLPIIDISCGMYHALILTDNLELYRSDSYNDDNEFKFHKMIM